MTPKLLDDNEFHYTQARMRVFARTMGSLESIECIQSDSGSWFATRAKIPIPLFNRIVISEPAAVSRAELEPVLKRFQEWGMVPTVEVASPLLGPELKDWLAACGFVASVQKPVFARSTDGWVVSGPLALECRRVQSMVDLEAFTAVYIQAWSIYEGAVAAMKSNIQQWMNLPDWYLYLAMDRGKPCGVAVLYLRNGVGYLADAATLAASRGRGAQTSLLKARTQEAIRQNVAVIYSRADMGSVSLRNLERAGLIQVLSRTSYSKISLKRL